MKPRRTPNKAELENACLNREGYYLVGSRVLSWPE